MRCAFCAEDVRDDASVCRYCGNDLKIPESLISENAALKEHLVTLQRELKELHSQVALRKGRKLLQAN